MFSSKTDFDYNRTFRPNFKHLALTFYYKIYLEFSLTSIKQY